MSAIHVEVSNYTHGEQVPLVRPAHAGGEDAALEAVDLNVLRAFEEMQVEGEPDLIVELIDLYLKDAPLKLASLLEADAVGDEGALKRAAHSLKGSSASIGVSHVAALCEELERVSRVDAVGQVGALLERLGQELERVRRAFEVERRRRS